MAPPALDSRTRELLAGLPYWTRMGPMHWALLGAVLVGTAWLAQVIFAGPGLMANCNEIPVGFPRARCSIWEAARPADGVVAALFVGQHTLMAAGAALATWGAWRMRLGLTLVGIFLTYFSFLPLPIYAGIMGWSRGAAEDLSHFEAMWGYLALGAWAWPLRGHFEGNARALLFALAAMLFVGGSGAVFVSFSQGANIGFSTLAILFAVVQFGTGLWFIHSMSFQRDDSLPLGLMGQPRPLFDEDD